MHVGLVLGGGGIVGQAYHGAVLAALHEAIGWDPRDAAVVVGTSAGAASGAELRAGISGADMAARREGTPFSQPGRLLLRELGPPPQVTPRRVRVDVDRARRAFRRLLRQSIMQPGSVRPGVLTSIAMSPGRLSTAWLQEQVRWLHRGDKWPAAALWTCAIDLDRGERVVFGRDAAPAAPLGAAVAASCAIPGAFAPVAIGRALYVDGGGWSASNADVLAGLGLDLVIVVSPMTAVPGAARDRADAMMRAACRWFLVREAAEVRAGGTPVAIIEPEAADLRCMGRIIGFDVLDESRCPSIVAQVRASTLRRLRAGRFRELRQLGGSSPAVAA
jgi:NTE family protein